MTGIDERWDAQQHSRWMRPDAARYLRPDMERYFTPAAWQAMTPAQRGQISGAEIERKEHVVTERSVEDLQRERSWLARQKLELLELYDLHLRLKAQLYSEKYSPNQPRVPKGNPDGGQWTNNGGGINDRRVLSDAAPADLVELRPGAQLAQLRGRGPRSSSGVPIEFTPTQAARYEALRAQADAAIARVREFSPNWRPEPSIFQTAEGAIRALEGELSQARTLLRELARKPDSSADGLLPARNREGPPASSFHGSKRFQLQAPAGPPRNPPGEFNGVPYSGHAFDQMQNRGLFPSVIDNVIRNGLRRAGNEPLTTRYYDPIVNISVIRNDVTGNIITVRGGDY